MNNKYNVFVLRGFFFFLWGGGGVTNPLRFTAATVQEKGIKPSMSLIKHLSKGLFFRKVPYVIKKYIYGIFVLPARQRIPYISHQNIFLSSHNSTSSNFLSPPIPLKIPPRNQCTPRQPPPKREHERDPTSSVFIQGKKKKKNCIPSSRHHFLMVTSDFFISYAYLG
jgi:hypothetical protein